MSAKFAPSARPAYAQYTWCDDNYIYVELPSSNKELPSYVMKFSNTEGGLSKALGLLRDAHRKQAPKGGYYRPSRQPVIRVLERDAFTQEQRTTAREILKKMGMI